MFSRLRILGKVKTVGFYQDSLSKSRRISTYSERFWKWTSQERPSWRSDIKEALIIFSVFGIAGSTSMVFVRPTLKYVFGLDGPFIESPVSYTLSTLLIASPTYAAIVFTVGTFAGRHVFFANMARKVISRFLPKSVRQKIECPVSAIKKM